MPPLRAVVVTRAYHYVLLGYLSLSQRRRLIVELRQPLARTGSNGAQALTFVALLAILAGSALTASTRRRR